MALDMPEAGKAAAGSAIDRRRIGGTEWQMMETGSGPTETERIEVAASHRTRKRRQRAKRKPFRLVLLPLTVAIAIIVGGLAGRTLSETSSALSTVHSVSTPPPLVGDATVRDTPVTLAGASNDPTPNGTEDASTGGSETDQLEDVTLTATPSGGSTTLQTVGTQPAGAGVQSAMPTPASVPSSSAATLAAPTPTPDGETLAEQLLLEGMTFDTAPAVAAIAQYQQSGVVGPTATPEPNSTTSLADTPPAAPESAPEGEQDDGGVLGSLQGAGQHLRDAAQGAAIAAGVSNPKSEPLTILVMGVDARPGSAIDIGVRPDALMVLRLDPEAGTCRGLAIPRDSYVELPGYGKTKINHALMLGGIPYEQLVVEQYLGIPIDHYALIDFVGFAELVDSVGGITIDVPPELASPAVEAGRQTIDGEQALLHARYRGGPDGDFGRIKRQQQIMRGLIAAANGRDLLTEATRLLKSLEDHIRTDMTIEELVGLATTYQDQCDVEGLDMDQIPGAVVYGPLIDPLFNLPLSYVVSEPEDVADAVDQLISGS
jgi:LCP family protein required for cell wall assembly